VLGWRGASGTGEAGGAQPGRGWARLRWPGVVAPGRVQARRQGQRRQSVLARCRSSGLSAKNNCGSLRHGSSAAAARDVPRAPPARRGPAIEEYTSSSWPPGRLLRPAPPRLSLRTAQPHRAEGLSVLGHRS